MPDLGFRDADQMDRPIRIAQISFANENKQIIEWLIDRGSAIKFDKFDEVKDINAKIVKNLKSPTKRRNCWFCYKKDNREVNFLDKM